MSASGSQISITFIQVGESDQLVAYMQGLAADYSAVDVALCKAEFGSFDAGMIVRASTRKMR